MCEDRPKVRTGSQEVEKTLDELFKYLINVLGYDRERAKRVIKEEIDLFVVLLVYFMIKVY